MMMVTMMMDGDDHGYESESVMVQCATANLASQRRHSGVGEGATSPLPHACHRRHLDLCYFCPPLHFSQACPTVCQDQMLLFVV